MYPTTSQNAPGRTPSWLSHALAARKDPESGSQVRDNPETNPVTAGPESSMRQEQSPWFFLPHPAALRPATLPSKAPCFVSMCVSLDNSLPSVRPELPFRPWKGLRLPHTAVLIAAERHAVG